MRPVAVVRPRRVLLAPLQPVDRLLEVLQLGVDQPGTEPGPLQLGLDVALAVGVGVPALGPGVQLDVGEHALREAAPRRAAGRRRSVGEMPWMLPRSSGWNGTSRNAWTSSGFRNSSQNWR